jgi:DNA-binding transcriptional regulator YdaS (Cro superfamily)
VARRLLPSRKEAGEGQEGGCRAARGSLGREEVREDVRWEERMRRGSEEEEEEEKGRKGRRRIGGARRI